MGDTTKPRQVRIPDGYWATYETVCARLGRTRAEDINDHIRALVEEHGTPEEIRLIEQADHELAQRRSRKGGRPSITAPEE
ncbi:hypothetical protein [Actinosynnema sp. NPDC023587]|uniref:hypothetical protein n=1 Tax=Actinosynnema sp. NPDC023587 TaxID=3154695 RepID=UPI0033D2C608